MPFSGAAGAKTYTRSDGVRSGTDVYAQQKAAGIDIVATQHDSTEQDLATGLNKALLKDGDNTATANIPMGNFKFTGLGLPLADAEAVTRVYAEDNIALVSTTLTVASGSVTPVRSRQAIDTEGAAATDNLDNIVTTNLRDGQLLYLYAADGSRIVTVRNAQGGAGQINTKQNRGIELQTEHPLILALLNNLDWFEVSSPAVSPIPLGSLTAGNSSSLDFTSLIRSDHKMIVARFQNLVPTVDGDNLYMRMADQGTTWSTTGYNWSRASSISTGTAVNGANGSSVARWEISDVGVGSAANETGVSGVVEIYNPLLAAFTHMTFRTETMDAAAAFISLNGGGVLQESLTHESLQVLFSSGLIESGTMQVEAYF